MKKSMAGRIALAVVLGTVSTAAMADWDGGHARLGLGGGRAQVEMDDFDLKGSGTAWEIIGGWEINRYLAIEASYIDAGNINDTLSIDGIGDVKLKADTNALTASVVGSLPLSDRFSVFGRAGLMHWKSKQSVHALGESESLGDFDGDDPIFGVGAAFEIETALVRLEYRIADLDDSDLSLLSLGIVWRF